MPDRMYVARRQPPSTTDRISAHWLEMTFAIFGIIRGFVGIFGGRYEAIAPAIDAIPAIPGFVASGSLVLGGILWIFAILRRFRTLNEFYHVIRTGLGLSFLGWVSHFAATIIFKTPELLTWSMTMMLSASVAGLYVQTFINERTIRERGLYR